jgi:hypothetical protein
MKFLQHITADRLSLWQLRMSVLAPPRPGAGEERVAKMKDAEHNLATYRPTEIEADQPKEQEERDTEQHGSSESRPPARLIHRDDSCRS